MHPTLHLFFIVASEVNHMRQPTTPLPAVSLLPAGLMRTASPGRDHETPCPLQDGKFGVGIWGDRPQWESFFAPTT